MASTQTLEQRVAHIEAELARVINLLPVVSEPSDDPLTQDLPFGAFANDPYFDEILQKMREERELETDNPAYT
jgi:hypothetical protein